jgi:hypothetical protein
MEGFLHLIIDSDYAKTAPFEWAYSIIGLTTIAVIAYVISKKRR